MTTANQTAGKAFQIVVGFDFSDLGSRAVDEALDIARSRAPAELHVVTVVHPRGVLVGLPNHEQAMTEDAARKAVEAALSKLAAENQSRKGAVGLERIALYVLTGVPAGEPGHVITQIAEAVEADLIVVGTHGRQGIARLMQGSVAAHVIRPADFVRGEKVPAIQPPLAPGEPHLKQFREHRTYHYVDKVSAWTSRTMPVG
jgi:nucleotide-binding universal stress UspA family protein